MSKHSRYARNVLKQYGKNIKAFEERQNHPLSDDEMRKTFEKYNLEYQRRFEVSWFLKRTHDISQYSDLEVIANG